MKRSAAHEQAVGRYVELWGTAQAKLAQSFSEARVEDIARAVVSHGPLGVSPRQVYNMAEGRTPPHLAMHGPLSVYARGAGTLLVTAEARLYDLGVYPLSAVPATAPTVAQTVTELAEAQAAQAQADTEALLAAADGQITGAEMASLEEVWARADREREQARDALRAMAGRPCLKVLP